MVTPGTPVRLGRQLRIHIVLHEGLRWREVVTALCGRRGLPHPVADISDQQGVVNVGTRCHTCATLAHQQPLTAA